LVHDGHHVVGSEAETSGMEKSHRNRFHGTPVALNELLRRNPMCHLVSAHWKQPEISILVARPVAGVLDFGIVMALSSHPG
jgi:hypothetical protein